MINQENFDLIYKRVMDDGLHMITPGVFLQEPPPRSKIEQHLMLQVQQRKNRFDYLTEVFKYVIKKKGR